MGGEVNELTESSDDSDDDDDVASPANDPSSLSKHSAQGSIAKAFESLPARIDDLYEEISYKTINPSKKNPNKKFSAKSQDDLFNMLDSEITAMEQQVDETADELKVGNEQYANNNDDTVDTDGQTSDRDLMDYVGEDNLQHKATAHVAPEQEFLGRKRARSKMQNKPLTKKQQLQQLMAEQEILESTLLSSVKGSSRNTPPLLTNKRIRGVTSKHIQPTTQQLKTILQSRQQLGNRQHTSTFLRRQQPHSVFEQRGEQYVLSEPQTDLRERANYQFTNNIVYPSQLYSQPGQCNKIVALVSLFTTLCKFTIIIL